MAFVTYILVVGYMLGMQDRFSPEVLGTTSGSALTMFILELIMIYLTTRIMSINTNLKMFDTMAFCMYKYVGMIFSLVVGMFFSSSGYYLALIYISLALALFLFRTLHLRVEPEVVKILQSPSAIVIECNFDVLLLGLVPFKEQFLVDVVVVLVVGPITTTLYVTLSVL